MNSVINTSPVHVMYLRKKNTWYTIQDGKWTDPNIWSSNGNRAHRFPRAGDNVIISHTVALDAAVYTNFVYNINDLTVTGKLLINAGAGTTFNVRGNLYADTGTIDMTGGGISFNLYGPVTSFGTLIPGTNNQVGFWGSCTQYISKPRTGDFAALYITDGGYVNGGPIVTKYLMYDMKDVAWLDVYQASLELGDHNIEFNAANFSSNGGAVTPALSRKGTGTTIFKGLCGRLSYMDFGNNSVEFRNGITVNVGGGGTINASRVNFTTNNQNMKGLLATTATTPVVIGAGLTLTVDGSTNTVFTIQGGINGSDAASTFYCSPGSGLTLAGPAAEPMVTGVWNMAGSVTYGFTSGSFLIKKPGYTDLNIFNSNNCTYTLGTDVTCSTILFFQSNLDLANYNMTVNGTAQVQSFQLKRTGSGNTVIKGLFSYGGSSQITLGTNTLELQAGLRNTTVIDTNNWLMGKLLLTTANQSFALNNIGNYIVLNGDIEIGAGLTVTNMSNITIVGTLNGQSASSAFDNQNVATYRGTQTPMQSGLLRCNTAANTFEYALQANQDINPGTYRNLTLSGGGAKRLLGNVSVINTYKLSAPATLNSNGFSLTNP